MPLLRCIGARWRRWGRSAATTGILVALTWTTAALAADQPGESETWTPLYRGEPYDVLVLNDREQSEFRILPLDRANRRLPDNPAPAEKLQVRLLDNPAEVLSVAWRNIQRVVLFEQLLLDEARQLVAARQFNRAFGYFEFLEREHPKWPGLTEAWHQALAAEAEFEQAQDRSDRALALWYELWQLNPRYAGIERRLHEAVATRLDELYAANQYAAARQVLQAFRQRAPQHSAHAEFEQQAAARAIAELERGSQAVAEKDIDAAYAATFLALQIVPDLPAAVERLQELRSRHPRVVVGVGQPALYVSDRIDDGAARRVMPLVKNRLIRLAEATAEGGRYEIVGGRVQVEPLERRIVLELPAAPRDTNVAYQLARKLLAEARPDSDRYRAEWSAVCGTVSIPSPREVAIDLRRMPLSAVSLLAAATRDDRSVEPRPIDQFAGGAYRAEIVPPTTVRFDRQAIDDSFSASAGSGVAGPVQIVERHFASSREALAALRVGEVDAVDHVPLWQLETLASDPQIAVAAYAVPTLHMLLVNPQKPLGKLRSFRRALVYGIDRARILEHDVLHGQRHAGCVVIGGPFSPGVSRDDPLRYAHDETVRPRAYDPRLAMALLSLAAAGTFDATKRDADDETEFALPTLILAHPPTESATAASAAIVRSLAVIGLKVELQTWPLGEPPPPFDSQIDLVYCEVVLADPLTDGVRLLGESGLSQQASPYLRETLRRLSTVETWPAARELLHRAHRLSADEAVVIPLWQTVSYFAHRRELTGLGSRPLTLYQHIDRWRLSAAPIRETAGR